MENLQTTYSVTLDIFEGPLDLLLYLIRKNNLDIYDIEISLITSQYLQYINIMKELNLDVAGEFLVMATTLMEIKSKSLLPKQSEQIEEDLEQIKKQLSDRLVEYQKYKSFVSKFLKPRELVETNVFYKNLPVFSENDYYIEATIFDMLTVMNEILKKVPRDYKEIVYEEIHIEEKIRVILDYLKEKKYAVFQELITLETTLRGIVMMFLALLELIKMRQVFARQKEDFGEIRIYPVFMQEED